MSERFEPHDGFGVFMAAFARAVKPSRKLPVSEWAAKHHDVPEAGGSPYPGRWKNETVPFLVEPMNRCALSDPCRSVTLLASAQSAKTAGVMCAVLAQIHQDPVPILIVLPTTDEIKKYNRVKLGPVIESTACVRELVLEQVSRDEQGSTTTYKKFPGGYLLIAGANSSPSLQMISAAVRVYEEPTEYPADTGGRGDPIKQAQARGKAWRARGDKDIYVSTPGYAGRCRITAQWEAGDRCRLYVPCPECGCYQTLDWDNLKWERGVAPYGAYFVCKGNGCAIEYRHREDMLRRYAWVPTFDGGEGNPPPPAVIDPEDIEAWKARPRDGREPAYRWWQAYSPFVPWDETVDEYLDCGGDVKKLKAFWQQSLGVAFEEKGEAPDADRLALATEDVPEAVVPEGVLYLTGYVDVQKHRLEWKVEGFDRAKTAHVLDYGVIEGDTDDEATWVLLDAVVGKTYPDCHGVEREVDWWGIDAQYRTERVHAFRRRHGNPRRVIACRGTYRPGLVPLASPSATKFVVNGRTFEGSVHNIGTHDLKMEVYERLAATLAGINADEPAGRRYRFPRRCDLFFMQQMTAEAHTSTRRRDGTYKHEWRKVFDRNEQLDLSVGCLALFHALTDGKPEAEWDRREAERAPQPAVEGAMAPLDPNAPPRRRRPMAGRLKGYD